MRKSYRQLSAEERVQIATLRGQGYALARIAQVLGRHRATVWREVKRNRAPHDGWYRSVRAHERAVARRKTLPTQPAVWPGTSESGRSIVA